MEVFSHFFSLLVHIPLHPNDLYMIPFEEALEICLSHRQLFGSEVVDLGRAVNRVTVHDICSDMNMPPFDKSAMDGYACRRADLSQVLKQVEVIQAGSQPKVKIGEGECAQIMTGAMVPEGADSVIMREETEEVGPDLIRFTGKSTRDNICRLGEDIQAGDVVIPAHTLLSTRHIPILASVGAVKLEVYKPPGVAVVATGTELVEPGDQPKGSQIRNSNGSQMIAQLAKLGLQGAYLGIAPDLENVTEELLRQAVSEQDLIILSGGVSMGQFDFVPGIIEKLGFNIHFQRVAIQPGKPVTFATREGKYIFGLPGNPVSSYFTFELFVKPFILNCMGWDQTVKSFHLPMGQKMDRKKSNRMGWVPVRFTESGEVIPLEYHGSAHIYALRDAEAMMAFPVGKTTIEKGEIVYVRPL